MNCNKDPAHTCQISAAAPSHEIVEAAKEMNIDLIVIATHGYTRWKHFCIGSTAERVVRAAPCPVLVVREKENEFARVSLAVADKQAMTLVMFDMASGMGRIFIPAQMPATNANADSQNKQLVDTLIRSRLFRDYESVFTKATGLPLALRPLEYWQLEHHQKTNENRFCALLAERPATLAVCLRSHAEIIERTGTAPRTETCPFGLTETAVPVRLGEKTIGFLRIGQVLRRSAIESDKKRAAAQLAQCSMPFAGTLRKAWEMTPIIPKDKYSAIVQLLTFFADQLSALINQVVIEQQNAEPLLVRKARDYIQQHRNEPLSLNQVAQAAGASIFHFCKVFKKTTGLKFTDYVTRVRLEGARTQLLNPNRRISEVAYGVGFQSLTQFNRTFKRVFGESPTDFRSHHTTGASPRKARLKPEGARR